MRLVSTRGVPDEPARRYWFRGTCRFTHDGRTETVEVTAAGNWDEASGKATEILEPVVGWGSVRSVFRCREDPWLPEEAPASCDLVEHTNMTGLEAFDADGSPTDTPGPRTGRWASPTRPDGSPASVAPPTPDSSAPAEVSPLAGAGTALVERVATSPRPVVAWSGTAAAQLEEVAALLAAGRSGEATLVWRGLLRAGPVGGAAAEATDRDALAMQTLRAAYLEPDEELRDQADRLRYYREQEEMAQARISELRGEGTGGGSKDAELRLMVTRIAEVRAQAREAAAELRAAIDRRPDVRDRLQEGWKALRESAGR